jgi:hypothetical protein
VALGRDKTQIPAEWLVELEPVPPYMGAAADHTLVFPAVHPGRHL